MMRAALALSALALASLAPAAAGAAPRGPVEVLFFLDTEDYTDPDTADSIKRFADLFSEEGVRAHFAVVGFLADQLERWGRRDVLDSLRPHLVGTQTLYHSRHPDICELTDVADFDIAYGRVFDEERRAAEAVRRATGCDRIWCAVPPGNSKSYAAFYAWADLGIPFVCDTVVWDRADSDIWYCNIRQVRYDITMEIYVPGWAKNPPDVPALLDSLASRRRVALYAHPHFAVRTVHWDSVNYNRTNAVPWGEWKPAPKRPEADTEAYFTKVRELVRALKADGRFRIADLSRLFRPAIRRDLLRDDLPTVKAALSSSLGPLERPGSWCVADVFKAVVGFLRGEGPHTPGKVYGFLSEPRGVESETSVSRQELVEAARRMDVSRFLPASIDVGGREIGPADFLFAALDALTTSADRFAIRPRDQLGDLDAFPELKSFRLRGTWVHTPQLEDRYLSDRLRWQLWTLRRDDW